MPESNVPEIIKYLTEDNLKLMYGRLNRRYLVVDALPSVDSLEPADKNVIYVVKETVGETVRYWPNVLDNDVWKPFGIGQADLDGKVDKVDAVEGHLVVADKNGNLVDADILPGTFVALAIDPSESIQPHATDLRKIWKAYQSGMPVTLLDNRPDGSGLYAHLNAAGYTWVDGNRMAEYLGAVDDDNRQCDGTIHGYRVERDGVVKFYEDDEHTVEIVPENGKLYCDDTVPDRDRVYLYNDGFVRALRFVQFSCNELIDDDPAWPSRRATRQVFYRMTEPYGSSSPDGFEVAYGESTADIHDQMVTGARIGDGKLLPVDDGVIVLPKSTAVNDGTLTITIGESEPVVFSANDSADRAVDIPVATDEVAGLVRITSDVDSDDPDAAITATAVLNELDSYVQKVDGTTAGHIAVFTSEGSMSDSGISSTDVESAIRHDHTHDNKSILDEVTAPYTTEEHAKLTGIEAGAQVNVIETVKVDGTALTVTDKAVDIDMSDKADKVPGATSGNFAALDASGNLTDSGSKAADFATAEQGIKADAAYQKPVDGIPKSDLDSGVQASLGKADTALQEHQDISGKVDKVYGKDLSTNDFTDNDKYKLDNIEADAQVNKIESISANNHALTIDANKNVDIPLATSEVDGLLPKEKFPLIPAAPVAGADRIYSFDDDTGTSWQTIVKEYVGNMILDQQGNLVKDEADNIMYDEEAVPLWLSYKGVEFGARRAYDDHTGANIHDSIASRTTMAQVTTAIETALANYGGFVVVNSLVDGHPDVQNPSERFIYLYKDPQSSADDPYTEWIYTASGTWDKIGTTSIDISNFAHKVANATGNIPKLDSNGDLVDSGVAAASLTNKPAADGGTDLSLVTTGEKYVWNNTRQLPDPTGHVNGSVLSLMHSTVQWDGDDQDDFVTFNFPEGVEVGGKLYKAIQIGSQIWMAENLDYRPAGFTEDIISGNVAAAYYQGHPEWGLLYNRAAAFWLRDNPSSLPSGWRVATETDFNTLITYIKNDRGQGTTDYNVGTYLKSVSGWTTANGSDLYGFNGIASGWYRAYQYIGGGSQAMYMTSTPYKTDSGSATVVFLEDGGRVGVAANTLWCGGSIRLVKDAPVEE